jgi:hypothetical protein
MAIGIILSVLSLGGLVLLLARAAVYALPAFAGVTAGLWAFNTGAGPIGALLVGAVAAAATLAMFRVAFRRARTQVVRALLAASFAIPAAYAGYHIVLSVS